MNASAVSTAGRGTAPLPWTESGCRPDRAACSFDRASNATRSFGFSPLLRRVGSRLCRDPAPVPPTTRSATDPSPRAELIAEDAEDDALLLLGFASDAGAAEAAVFFFACDAVEEAPCEYVFACDACGRCPLMLACVLFEAAGVVAAAEWSLHEHSDTNRRSDREPLARRTAIASTRRGEERTRNERHAHTAHRAQRAH